MNLYDRDFTILTDEETVAWEELKQEKAKQMGSSSIGFYTPVWHKYPAAVRHYTSLFPNNFIDPITIMNNVGHFNEILHDFKLLLSNRATTEQDILRFINRDGGYFIAASLITKGYGFGHHGTYMFPEFPLGSKYVVDYLLIGSNSDGLHLLFVEFEDPYKRITLKDGSFGDGIRKGIEQIEDWKLWLDSNYHHLREYFESRISPFDQALPRELYTYKRYRIHFAVVAGRREHYTEKTYDRRIARSQNNLDIYHYDNLVDQASKLITFN